MSVIDERPENSRPAESIYQFEVTLRDSRPKIWRRIQVPMDYNFWALHVAIQDAMGWKDCHLHQFKILNPRTGVDDFIGIPSDDYFFGPPMKPGIRTKLSLYFSPNNKKAIYEYDFGDCWDHDVVLEKIALATADTTYPKCTAGMRACPPEDCGGIYGYEGLVRVLADPSHREYEEKMKWLRFIGNEDYRPEVFDANEVFFNDPISAWNLRQSLDS